jgi:hypothetical protein
MKKLTAPVILFIFASLCFVSCNQKKGDLVFTTEEIAKGNFDPRYEFNPWPEVDVQVFPPRLRGRNGVSMSKMNKTPDGLTWSTILGNLNMECHSKTTGDKIELEMIISNKGNTDEVVAVLYPKVHYVFNEEYPLRVLDPTFGGVLEPRKPYPMVDVYYPGYASFCATLVTGREKAIGIALRNKEQRSAHIRHLPAAPAGQMSIELDRVFVAAGESVVLPSAFIAYGADWSSVLKPYRDWLLASFPPRMDQPSWFKNERFVNVGNAHCMVPFYPPSAAPGIWVFDPAFKKRTIENVRDDIDKGIESAARRNCKALFYQFGWWNMMSTFEGLHMFDGVCGDYTEAHKLTREAINYIHSKGGRTILYTNFISAGEESNVFREQPGLFARDEHGAAIRNVTYPMFMFCPGSPGIREYWDKVLHHVLIELDADGIFLDQVGGATPSPVCTDPGHHHAHCDTYGQDFLALLDYVYYKAKEIKKDAFVGCELINDIRSMWTDWIQSFGYNRPTEMKFASPQEAANTPPHEYMVFLKYINPYGLMVPGRPDQVAFGAPGMPDDTIFNSNEVIFRSGLLPCKANPVGAMAYLYGPVNGEAILVTKAWDEIRNVDVRIPSGLKPVTGGTDIGKLDQDGNLIVDAGKNARFYKLAIKD